MAPQKLALASVAATGILVSLAACSGPSSSSSDTGELTMLIASSGEAETTAIKTAVSEWSESSGTGVDVIVASDLSQQLSQGFASGKPADVMFVNAENYAAFAAKGAFEPFFNELPNVDDVYQPLKDAFTYDGVVQCAPKGFSTLGLVINDTLWAEAGLTDADIPTDWDELSAVAKKLTTAEHAGLTMDPQFQRYGTFMAQNGGWLVNDDATKATVDTTENTEALGFVQQMLNDGVLQRPADLGTGWGGEAFGKGLAAMTVEGNWIVGALKADYPDVDYSIAALPDGPDGPATIEYSGCWAIPAESETRDDAVSLVEHLTSTETQTAFAEAYGVMPSVQSAADAWSALYPDQAGFIELADHARFIPAIPGLNDVLKDMNAQLESLASADIAAILSTTQTNLQAVLDEQK